MEMLIKKIACAVIALVFVLVAFTGCGAGKTASAKLPEYTSVKDADGNLAQKGKVGDIEYKILDKTSYGTHQAKRGYYIDQLEQLDSPYFIVVCSGSNESSSFLIHSHTA